jgi:hypothetical protein
VEEEMPKDDRTLNDMRTQWEVMPRSSRAFEVKRLLSSTLVCVIDELLSLRKRVANLEPKVLDDGK